MLKKELNRKKRHRRILKRVVGTAEKPRLVVKRALKNFHIQVVNDLENKVVLGVSTTSKEFRKQHAYGGNVVAAKDLAKLCAEKMKQSGISTLAFDRAGYQYHGRIQAFADALREEGLQF